MRHVPRGPAPEILSSPPFARMRAEYLEFLTLDPRRRAQTRPPDRHLPTGLVALDLALRMLFTDRCAFCESRTTLQPHRFRPTSEALPIAGPEGMLAYGWLADAWQNLYPICSDCRPSPVNHFPVEGDRVPLPPAEVYAAFQSANDGRWPHPPGAAPWAGITEKPLLLDPCEDAGLADHLVPQEDGLLEGASARGVETIRTFNLNREGLVALRHESIDRHKDRLAKAVDRLTADPTDEFASVFPGDADFPGFLHNLARARAFAAQMDRRNRKTWTETFVTFDPARDGALAAGAAPEAPAYSTPPSLIGVSIRSFKALESLDLTLPPPETPEAPAAARLILGENAAGKSSILEAIALALASPAARKAVGARAEKLLLDPRFMGGTQAKRRNGTVTLTFRSAEGQDSRLTLRLNGRGFTRTGSAPAGLPVFAYGAYRHYLDTVHDWTDGRGIVSLFRSDNLLSNPETWLAGLKPAVFDEVVQGLRYIFGEGGGFERLERGPRGVMVVTRPDGADADEGDTHTPLSSVSSGFRTVLALTCDVMRWILDPARGWRFPTLRAARGILLIDEVEAHLHPRWKVQIMAGLRKALPGMTLIATTHDPLCLRGMRDGEVMVLRRIPGENLDTDLPVKVETLTTLPDVQKLTVEQLLTSDFFALYDTDDLAHGAAMAELADALALRAAGSEPGPDTPQGQLLARFEAEVTDALPVGRSEVSMLVQEAVADYIRAQRRLPDRARQTLRDSTRARIAAILKGQRDAPG